METYLIYIVGEMLMLNEIKVKKIIYAEGEPPAFCIAELKNGIKIKVEVLQKDISILFNYMQSDKK